jgi:4-hydroxy-tetrahydrodipicolinate synthase
VAIVSPFYYRVGPEGVYAYFREIAASSPIDVTLYNIPMFASPIDVATIRRLAELPRIVGIKDSSGDISFMMRMMAAVEPVRPDFAFLTGWEAAMLPMLMVGCHGGTHATSGVTPEATQRLYEWVKAERWEEARALQFEITALFDLMLGGGDFPEGFRRGVEARGFSMGASRQPTGADRAFDASGLRAAIDRVLKLVS